MGKQPALWQFEEATKVVLLKLCYVRVTGDLVAGLLLSQLVWWYRPSHIGNSKLSVFRDDRWWVAKSQETWCNDLGISVWQFKSACNRLAGSGLVRRKVWWFRNIRTLHLSLDDGAVFSRLKLLGLLKKFETTKVKNLPFSKGGKSPLQKCKTAKSYNSTETTKAETTTETTGGKAAKAIMHSSETLKTHKGKFKPKEGDQFVKHGKALGSLWNHMVPYYHNYYDIHPFKSVTRKEEGMLGDFMKRVGSALNRDGRGAAYGVMHWAVRNWGRFCLDVQKQKDETAAQLPTVGALFKHYDVAVGGHHTSMTVQLTANSGKVTTLTDAQVEELLKSGSGG